MRRSKRKHSKTDRSEEFADRIAAEINKRAAKMTPERRARVTYVDWAGRVICPQFPLVFF